MSLDQGTTPLPVQPPSGATVGHLETLNPISDHIRRDADPQLPQPVAAAAFTQVSDRLPSLSELLSITANLGGSDLHLAVGAPPTIRVHGELQPLKQYPPLDSTSIRTIINPIMDSPFAREFDSTLEADGSWTDPAAGRYRINLMQASGALGATFRRITSDVPDVAQLGLPPIIEELCEAPQGLILVAGPTGSGKSTTLAAMIKRINASRPGKIITVEDPIEFIHHHNKSLIVQREVGGDTLSFHSALKHALRQDPDVILVGEMRDPDTIATAVTAAETGHLVLSTVHSRSAGSTISRIIEAFPAGQQAQIRAQLAESLVATINQSLLPHAQRQGRVAALEIMIATPAIRTMIRESKIEQIPSAQQAGGKFGMQTLNQHLAYLVKAHAITKETAFGHTPDSEELIQLLGSE